MLIFISTNMYDLFIYFKNHNNILSKNDCIQIKIVYN